MTDDLRPVRDAMKVAVKLSSVPVPAGSYAKRVEMALASAGFVVLPRARVEALEAVAAAVGELIHHSIEPDNPTAARWADLKQKYHALSALDSLTHEPSGTEKHDGE